MMVWTVLGTIALIMVTVAWLIVPDAIGLSTWFFAWLLVRGIWQFAGSMENKGSDHPVYKKNLQRLIERNREFEEARKRNEPRS